MEEVPTVESVEKLIDKNQWVVRGIKADAAEALHKEAGAQVNIEIHATITRVGESSGVARLGSIVRYSAADLYSFAETPAIELTRTIKVARRELQRIVNSDLEFCDRELIWLRCLSGFTALRSYYGISDQHDELITALATVGIDHAEEPFDTGRVVALISALAAVEDRLQLTDKIVDEFEDILEQAGFDLDASLE